MRRTFVFTAACLVVSIAAHARPGDGSGGALLVPGMPSSVAGDSGGDAMRTVPGRLATASLAGTNKASPVAGQRVRMASRVDPTGRPWRHNGSIVMADPGTGVIAYLEPKASLRPSVEVGTVLFRGSLHPDRPVRGTAYAYKAGCPAAPYPVTGAYSGPDTLTLRGAGPVRQGCEVVGYSDRSPHAVLRFTYLLDD